LRTIYIRRSSKKEKIRVPKGKVLCYFTFVETRQVFVASTTTTKFALEELQEVFMPHVEPLLPIIAKS
jgi:hypothetical protein